MQSSLPSGLPGFHIDTLDEQLCAHFTSAKVRGPDLESLLFLNVNCRELIVTRLLDFYPRNSYNEWRNSALDRVIGVLGADIEVN